MVKLPRFTPTAFKTKNLGVTLEVNPKLNKDGTIELDLRPTVASFIGFVSEKDGVKTLGRALHDAGATENWPVFSTSTGPITATVGSGQTILLGAARIDCNTGTSMLEEFAGSAYPAEPEPGVEPETVRHVLLVFVTAKTEELNLPAQESPSPSASPSPAASDANGQLPAGIPVPGKQGFVTSPYAPTEGEIDVRGFPAGTEVKDPYTGKIFLVP